MQEYVCGFAFDNNAARVALIQKLRPQWQAGLWNGIGGHIEADESAGAAMLREFREETGVRVTQWRQFLWIEDECKHWRVKFYRAFGVRLGDLCTTTDEKIWSHIIHNVPQLSVIPNLRWIIPLAADQTWYERGTTATSVPVFFDTSGIPCNTSGEQHAV